MRYINSFKVFESASNTIEDLKDIFFDVEEEGFKVYVEKLTSLYNYGNVFKVSIYKSEFPVVSSPDESYRFRISDILDTLLRSSDYMGDLGYKVNYMNSKEVGCGVYGIGYSGRSVSMLFNGEIHRDIQKIISNETFHLTIEFTKNS